MAITDVVMVVEDENESRERVQAALKQGGFRVVVASEAMAAWREILECRPDAVILDLLLPGMHGLDLLREMRRAPTLCDVPVLVLSARDTEMDMLLCFENGADDYMAKPFSPRELVARVRGLLRRARPGSDTGTIEIGSLRIDPGAREAAFDGRAISLTPREFDLLLFLVRHPGRVMSRSELLRNVWGFDHQVDPRAVDVHVRRLRSKLGDSHRVIETVTGAGYKLVGPSGSSTPQA